MELGPFGGELQEGFYVKSGANGIEDFGVRVSATGSGSAGPGLVEYGSAVDSAWSAPSTTSPPRSGSGKAAIESYATPFEQQLPTRFTQQTVFDSGHKTVGTSGLRADSQLRRRETRGISPLATASPAPLARCGAEWAIDRSSTTELSGRFRPP